MCVGQGRWVGIGMGRGTAICEDCREQTSSKMMVSFVFRRLTVGTKVFAYKTNVLPKQNKSKKL